MTAPTARLTVTERYKLKELTWHESQVVPPGKVMFCRGRKIVTYGTVEGLARVRLIPPSVDTACLSPADYADVQRWIA